MVATYVAPRTAARPMLWPWVSAGLVCGLACALLLFAPARWVTSWISAETPGLLLVDAQGTLWNGSAQVYLQDSRAQTPATSLPGRLHWQVQPNWLGLHLALSLDCCTSTPMEMDLTPHRTGYTLAIDRCASQWPAWLLIGLGTPWNTIELDGQLALSCAALRLQVSNGQVALTGSATLDLRDVSSRLSTMRPLGSYQLTFAGDGNPTVQLRTVRGALHLEGTGRWIEGRLKFDGWAGAASQETEAVLSNLLNIIGRRQGQQSIISLS